MDKTYTKGQRLFITTNDGAYNATFQSMDSEKTRLTVKDVVKLPLKEPYDGVYHFYRDEILSVQIMDPVAFRATSPGNHGTSRNLSVMKGCSTSSPYRTNNESYVPCVLPSQALKYYENLLKKYVIIDKTDENFEQAVEYLKKQRIIGVSFEGVQLGRKGRLSWISVSSPTMTDDEGQDGLISVPEVFFCIPSRVIVFIFDMVTMGRDAIELGLGEILQGSDSPNKVIHDCRLPSDILYHHLNVKLENVLDSQVGEIVQFPLKYHPAERKDIQPLFFTRGLYKSLMTSLGLPEYFVYEPVIHDGYIQRDMETMNKRPITRAMARAATHQSMYLINLWCKIQDVAHLEAYKQGVSIYLSSVRDADDDTALYLANCYHIIPDEFCPLLIKHRENVFSRNKYQKSRNAHNLRN